MRVLRISVCCLVGLPLLLIALHSISSHAQEKLEQKVKAEHVLKEWEFPKAEIHGPHLPSNDAKDAKEGGYADLATEWFSPKEPMEKVWKHYAGKCGYEGKYPGPGAGVMAGSGDKKARCLMNFSGGSERHKYTRCTFAYNTDRYTVFVELVSAWDDDSTTVQVTAGTRE